MFKIASILLFVALMFFSLDRVKSNDSTDAEKIVIGESLFNKHCTLCHTLGQINTGPQLAGITKIRSEEWLHAFISDASVLVDQQDSIALAVFSSHYNIRHVRFKESLSAEEISSIIVFLSKN
jgi:mono/diheme cytochrome c family protein